MILTAINNQLFLLINAAPDATKLTVMLAIFCAQYLIYLPIIISIFCWLVYPSARGTINKMIVITLTSLFVAAILRSVIISSRPFDLPIGTNFLSHSSSNSFPSKHATVIFAMAFTLFYTIRGKIKQKMIFISILFVAIAIGWARIYLGVHWPFDIVASALVSGVCAYGINKYEPNLSASAIFLASKSYAVLSDIISKRKITK